MNMDFPNIEIQKYRRVSVGERGRDGGEYRNKKRLATPRTTTTSKYTNKQKRTIMQKKKDY